MAKRYDAMNDPEKAAYARDMAEQSRKAGRSLREGEKYQERQFDKKGQGLLW
jgi:hypothetical protein